MDKTMEYTVWIDGQKNGVHCMNWWTKEWKMDWWTKQWNTLYELMDNRMEYELMDNTMDYTVWIDGQNNGV